MKKIILLLLIYSINLWAQTEISKVHIFKIENSINPAVLNYLKTGFKKVQSDHLILIKMNTPGGLVSTTKDIITLIGETSSPTAIWVTPEGASATSAGAIISSSAHYLFMSEGANIGAATPIGMDGDIKQKDARSKAINDLVALVKSLSESRGRDPKSFGEMITDAKSFSSDTALSRKIIDAKAKTIQDIFNFINKNPKKILGTKTQYKITNPEIQDVKMDLGQSLLNVFANPSLAYLLFLIGAALLYFEFQAPGGFIAGSIGVVSLILAGIAFQVLPLNLGALGLIVVSFVLFVLEAYITSYGILTLGGLAALIFGSLFLFRGNDSYLAIQTSLIISAALAIVLFMGIIAYMMIRDRKKIGATDFYTFKNSYCDIVKDLGQEGDGFIYKIKVAGEYWNAFSKNKLDLDAKANIIDHDEQKLRLIITQAKES